MKFVTYNLWESNAGMPLRLRQIADALTEANADVACVQEAADTARLLADLCGYPYILEKNDLAVLSRFPMEEADRLPHAMAVRVWYENMTILVANAHLPWDSALEREKAIVQTVRGMGETEADYSLLMGDFNSAADSSVYRYLTNAQSLLGSDAYFFDLAAAWAERMGKTPAATLDFRRNPRWKGQNTVEVNLRCDWIMLQNPYPKALPVLEKCDIFGTAVSDETRLAPSDHYGLAAEIVFPKHDL